MEKLVSEVLELVKVEIRASTTQGLLIYKKIYYKRPRSKTLLALVSQTHLNPPSAGFLLSTNIKKF